MANNPRDKHRHGGQSGEPPAQHHGSTAEETRSLNETLKSFAKKYYEPDEKKDRRERVKFRLEIALGLGVAANILLTAGLLIAGAKQTSYSGDQVKASQDQLGIMKDTEERQLRAYVGIIQHGIENFGEPIQVLNATRKNYGATPAIDMFMGPIRAEVVQSISQFGPTLCSPVPKVQNTLAVFPGQEIDYHFRGPNLSSTGKPITQQQIDLVRSGDQYQMLFWGALYYKDIFGNQRCTRYCWGFKGKSMTEKDMELCFQHNDAY